MRKLLLLFLLLVPTYQGAHALTLSALKVEVRRYIDDTADPKIKYTDALLTSLINEAQREVVNQTWCLTSRSTQALSVGTTYYTLPSNVLALKHVEFRDGNNRTRELEEASERATQQDNPDYERIAGPPMQYFVRGSTASSATQLQIAFLPIATTSSSTGTVTIDYYKQATDLSADTDVPFDSQQELYPYHYALVYSVVGKIKLINKEPDAATYLQMSQAYLTLMMDRLGRMPNYNPGFRSTTK